MGTGFRVQASKQTIEKAECRIHVGRLTTGSEILYRQIGQEANYGLM